MASISYHRTDARTPLVDILYIIRVGYEKLNTLNEQNVSSLNVLVGLMIEKEF